MPSLQQNDPLLPQKSKSCLLNTVSGSSSFHLILQNVVIDGVFGVDSLHQCLRVVTAQQLLIQRDISIDQVDQLRHAQHQAGATDPLQYGLFVGAKKPVWVILLCRDNGALTQGPVFFSPGTIALDHQTHFEKLFQQIEMHRIEHLCKTRSAIEPQPGFLAGQTKFRATVGDIQNMFGSFIQNSANRNVLYNVVPRFFDLLNYTAKAPKAQRLKYIHHHDAEADDENNAHAEGNDLLDQLLVEPFFFPIDIRR